MGDCRKCSISAAIGFALDICQQENIKVDSLEKIFSEGYQEESEVLTALEEFNSKVPTERKIEAKSIKCFVFTDNNDCKIEV
jgi:hypothetical protein